MRQPALLAVAHGSRDPRHAAALHGLLAAVRRAGPGLRAELGFLDLCGPDVPAALARLVASEHEETDGENRSVIVLPLFLSHGYHVGHDIPAVTALARRSLPNPPRLIIADPLGPDPLLDAAMRRRLREQGEYDAESDLGLVVASATIAPAETMDAIRVLRSGGIDPIAVASYFLAPGLLYDRVRADALAARVPIAAPLTTADSEPPVELVQLVLNRYAQAAGQLASTRALSASRSKSPAGYSGSIRSRASTSRRVTA
ncbi:MAG TPA: CbiX/SirB N-terminal domain-containing protein [Actinocrinis sp.]|nr:CbiX/SirB N-terminal domain-containing protein [Actinocrinis sp.]